MSDPAWPAPNLTLLNSALRQTGWAGEALHPENWRATIRRRLDALAWDRVAADVRPFLEREADVELLTRENAVRLLSERMV